MINDKDIDIKFTFDNIIFFYKSPNILVDIYIKDIDKNIICSFNNTQLFSDIRVWLKVDNIHLYDEILIEFYQNENMIYDKLFFMNPEKSYIKREDLTIILNNNILIDKMINKYKDLGIVKINENLSNKYVLILNGYLLNIVEVINKMYLNNEKTVVVEKDSPGLRFIKEELWNKK